MTLAEENGREPGGDDMIAAEYVLGVLPADERAATAARIERDAAFARLVESWEAHFSPMASGYAEVEPPQSVKQALDNRLFAGAAEAPASTGSRLLQSLAFWRGLTAAALAALAIAVAVPLLRQPSEQPGSRLVASLGAEGSDVRYVALYDAQHQEVGLTHLSGERGTDRDFELWMIEGKSSPVSLGVIPAGQTIHVAVEPAEAAKIASGATFAISLEPKGGSPTGQPTGPVVAAGELRKI